LNYYAHIFSREKNSLVFSSLLGIRTMSRKHFKAVAETVAKITDAAMRQQIAELLAAQFAMINPRFDRARFLAACATG
jgi:hypothetical protein